MANEARIRELLAQNIPPSVVAEACGVSPSYISQLMQDESFATSVAEGRATLITQELKREEKIDAAIDKMLDASERMAMMASADPNKWGRLLSQLYDLRRSSERLLPTNASTVPEKIVQIVLPAAIAPQFVIENHTSQVISVDGRSLQTLQAANLRKLAELPALPATSVAAAKEAKADRLLSLNAADFD